ncbi:MAG: 4Fe-4S binding protein [Spirochaetes bacterium]|nr:4Fe-4S binding protein [Spirochaetota bacterium]
MPIRYPRVKSGKDINILKHFYLPEEAEIALGMSFKMETAEEIAARLKHKDIEEVRTHLYNMVKKASVIYRKENELFGLVPFVVGMFEFQIKRISKDYLKLTFGYIAERFAFEFLTTKKPQTRIIPLNQKIENQHKIQSYDEYFNLIKNSAGRLVAIDCICRTAKDHFGKPCEISDRRETCLALRDYADLAEINEWGRKISLEEAMDLARQNQEEGLVIQSANDQNPNFICACCKDCCGLLSMFKAVPHPAEYVASNYSASVDMNTCVGCTLCVKICPMDAIYIHDKKAFILKDRCIGCGVCTIKCPKNSISLIPRKKNTVPPETVDDLYDELSKSRINPDKKATLIFRFIKQIIIKKFKTG